MEIDFSKIDLNNTIIDVRHGLDYKENHIDNSINITRLKLLNTPEKYLEKDSIYYLICDKGKVSKSVSKILNSLGYKCYSIKGGIEGINK